MIVKIEHSYFRNIYRTTCYFTLQRIYTDCSCTTCFLFISLPILML